MPQGKGTYGSQVGKPPKKKYYGGGSVDPFSTKNPEGVPAQQAVEAMEQQNMAKSMEDAIPTSNAMERSQVSPDTTEYKEGGKVKSNDDYRRKGIKTTEDYMKTDYKPYEDYWQGKVKKKAGAALEGKGNITDVVKEAEASKEYRETMIDMFKRADRKKRTGRAKAPKRKKGKKK